MTANYFYHFVCDLILFLFIFGCVPSPMNCLYCATLHCRSLINSHLCRLHHIVACLKITAKNAFSFLLSCNFMSGIFTSCHLMPYIFMSCKLIACNLVRQFLVLQFDGPLFSCPSFSVNPTKSQCPVSYGHDQYTCRKSRRFKRYRGNSHERKRPATTCKPRALLIHHQ